MSRYARKLQGFSICSTTIVPIINFANSRLKDSATVKIGAKATVVKEFVPMPTDRISKTYQMRLNLS